MTLVADYLLYSAEASTKRTIIYILFSCSEIQREQFSFFREFSRPLVPVVSKSFVLSLRATAPPNPLAMQIKPCILSKTFQSVPNSRSQDLSKFTASNLTSQDLCQNLLLRFIPHICKFFSASKLWGSIFPYTKI